MTPTSIDAHPSTTPVCSSDDERDAVLVERVARAEYDGSRDGLLNRRMEDRVRAVVGEEVLGSILMDVLCALHKELERELRFEDLPVDFDAAKCARREVMQRAGEAS